MSGDFTDRAVEALARKIYTEKTGLTNWGTAPLDLREQAVRFAERELAHARATARHSGLRLVPADASVVVWRTDLEAAPDGDDFLGVDCAGCVFEAHRGFGNGFEAGGGMSAEVSLVAWAELPAGPTRAASETEGEG